MIEKIVRAFLVIFILVALAMIVATLLGFSAQVEEFLENVIPTRYQIMANSCLYQNAFHGFVDPGGHCGVLCCDPLAWCARKSA